MKYQPEKYEGTTHKMDNISSLILKHSQSYHPKMVAEFQRENRLEAELKATVQQFDDLMYNLVVVQKMSYSSAWEIAIDQFLLPEEEESSLMNQNQKDSQHGTSE